MKRILVPTDFSEQAINAFEVAVAVARKAGAAIKLLHVVDMPGYTSFNVTGEMQARDDMDKVFVYKLLERTKLQMQQLLEMVDHEGVHVVQEVDSANIFKKIREVIDRDNVDLVVMGSKGASGMDEFLIGSNTEKVVRTAPCPVMTVKDRHPNFEVNDIVLASNFKNELDGAIDNVIMFQQMFDARLHLVYINTPGSFESNRNMQNTLESVAQRYGLQNYTVNVYSDILEEDGILHFVEDINADLIMMATHGRTGLAHLFSGSIAEDLVNHTMHPVITFHVK